MTRIARVLDECAPGPKYRHLELGRMLVHDDVVDVWFAGTCMATVDATTLDITCHPCAAIEPPPVVLAAEPRRQRYCESTACTVQVM